MKNAQTEKTGTESEKSVCAGLFLHEAMSHAQKGCQTAGGEFTFSRVSDILFAYGESRDSERTKFSNLSAWR